MDSISIIIPVKNAGKYIKKCLDSIQQLDYPSSLIDVIVVDNGSIDETMKIVKEYPYQTIVNTTANISQLRNIGTTKANGTYLAFVDADCIVSKSWLTEAVRLLQDEKIGAVGCWHQLPVNATFIEKVWDAHTGLRRNVTGPIDWIPTASLIIKKEIFEKVSGFDENLVTSEDVNICNKIIKLGKIVYSHPKLAPIHLRNPKNSLEFFKKEKWRGEGVIQQSIQEFPKFNNAILFAIYEMICLVSMTVCLIMRQGNNFLLFFLLSFLPVIVLAVKAVIKSRKYFYFIPLVYLFYLYGISRACSFLNLNLWKLNSKLK